MKRAVTLTLAFCLLLATTVAGAPARRGSSQSQDAELTNKDVLDMIKAGLAEEIIVTKIRTSRARFDTTATTLAELKGANVPDAVIMAMVERSAVPKTEPTRFDLVEVAVPDGTEMEIQLKNTLSGQEAKVGDIVDFTLVRAIELNGVTIFERDASARARVTTAKKAGRWGKAGKIEWAMQDVQAVDGNRIPVRFTKRELGDSKGGTVAVAAVATTVLLGPVGLLWGLKKGKPAVIPAGNRYSVFVHGDTKIKGKQVSSAP